MSFQGGNGDHARTYDANKANFISRQVIGARTSKARLWPIVLRICGCQRERRQEESEVDHIQRGATDAVTRENPWAGLRNRAYVTNHFYTTCEPQHIAQINRAMCIETAMRSVIINRDIIPIMFQTNRESTENQWRAVGMGERSA